MLEIITAIGLSFWVGILTSISPCPLATNIAAITFIGKEINNRKVIISGILYTIGRSIVYLAIGMLMVFSLISAPELSMWLQKYMNMMLGPILVLTGMILLELLDLSFINFGLKGSNLQNKISRTGILSGFFFGVIFALSFCPVSAALFFGTLIPLSIKHDSVFLIPTVYGIGTAIPVIIFAILIALGAGKVQSVFNKITKIEIYFRKGTGLVFIIIGVYFILTYIFEIF